jgi:Ca2+-binding RTX toxin-like protein
MRLLFTAILATLILAAPASAARFQHNGADIDFTTGLTDTVRITATGHELGDPKQVTFTRGTGGTAFTIGAGCSQLINTGVVRCGVSDDTRLRFTTNEKPDVIDASRTTTPLDASVPEIFDTKGGDDVLTAGPLADEVRAGNGRDTITGGPGADLLSGDADDDRFAGLDAGDVVNGGDGTDTLDLTGEVAGMSISLNGVADDGPLGANASVLAVETVLGTPSNDILTGGDAIDRLEGREGDDRIDTRGGGADAVDCGPGTDVAIVDEADSVTGCEQIELPPLADPGGQPDTGPAAPDPVTPPALAAADADRDGAAAAAGGAARVARVGGRLSFEFTAFPNGTTRVDRLVVRELQSGARAELRCAGRCSFRKKVGKASRGKVDLRRLIRGRLRTGATLEVRLSAPGTVGRVVRFKMRKAKPPKRTSLCLPPGGKVGRCA